MWTMINNMAQDKINILFYFLFRIKSIVYQHYSYNEFNWILYDTNMRYTA